MCLMRLQVTFYGLLSGAEMAAHVFEVAYNAVMEFGELEYGGKGEASKKEDYRCALAKLLLRLQWDHKSRISSK